MPRRRVGKYFGNYLPIYLYDLYDESGAPIGLQYRNEDYQKYTFDTYYFEKNLQGDIIAIYTEAGVKIGSYTYDAWGNCIPLPEPDATAFQKRVVRTLNPFRYRAYYYDTETSLYYLQSRYYNPAWGRFLNADGYVSTGTGLLGYNMYAYCTNNPIMNVDPTGCAPKWWQTILIGVAVIAVGATSKALKKANGAAPFSYIHKQYFSCAKV